MGRQRYSWKQEELAMKYVWGSLKALRTLLFVGFLAASLALNVAMFVGGTLYTAASSLVETVTGFRTVASRHAAEVADLADIAWEYAGHERT
jgi:hypothetical protein